MLLYGCTEGQVRERVAPCRQQGFWEILPAFRDGEIYSLLVVGDGYRAWERALFGMKKCILAVVRVAICSGCSMVWVWPYVRLFMSMIWCIDDSSCLAHGVRSFSNDYSQDKLRNALHIIIVLTPPKCNCSKLWNTAKENSVWLFVSV